MSRRTRIPISLLIGAAIGVVGLVYVAFNIADQWGAVRDRLTHVSLVPLVIGVILAAAGMTAIALAWRPVLIALGAAAPKRRDVVRWYFVGEIGKYVPGGLWTVVGRAELARRSGLSRSSAYGSVALSLLCLQVAAACVAAFALPMSGLANGHVQAWLVLLVIPIGLGALHPKVAGSLLTLISRLTKREFSFAIPNFATTFRLVAGYIPAWICIGASTALIARSLAPHAPFAKVFAATIFSWIIGFLVIFTPGGIGVREGAFTAMLSLPAGIAVTTSLVARLLFMAVDGTGALLTPILFRSVNLEVGDSDTAHDATNADEP